jgi:serine/threonine protein kinase
VLTSGEFISHYRIVSSLGAGGMGEVYLAEDTKLDRKVALKVLIPEVASDKDRLKRFVREAKAASALNHPNILTVYEIGSFAGSEYISTELINGETLRDRLKREPLSLREALTALTQVTAALCASHEAGIIHRDIKPENIMIRRDGLVKVLDFGLAKMSPISAASVEVTMPQINTKPGMIVGTIAYMSPEQARGRQIDPRSDIFSLGIVMFELFSGRRPFEGENQLELISSILKDEAPPLRQLVPDIPQELERIVEKSLRKDRDHRYQHVKDLHIDLEDLADEIKFESKANKSVQPTIDADAHTTIPSNLRSAFTTGISKTRRFTLLHAMIFVVLAAVSVGAVWFFGPSRIAMPEFQTTEIASWSSTPGELTSSASFSPDGKLIAFTSTKSGTKSIWVKQIGSSDPIQITNDQFSNSDPIWSPKGDEIAFVSLRSREDGALTGGIWRIGALGGTAVSVAPIADGSLKLRRWGVSGKIYYELKGELYALEISNGNSEKVTDLVNRSAKSVSIGPDERSITYAVASGERWQIFKMENAAATPIEVASGAGRLDSYILAHGTSRIFFNTTVESKPQIWATVPGSGRNDRILIPETESSLLDAAPDGRSFILGTAKEDSQLWSVSAATGVERSVARDVNAKLWPAISNDNERITYQSVRNLSSGNRVLRSSIVVKSMRQGTDGERPIMLTEEGYLASWSPDGRTIAFLKQVGDNEIGLFTVDSSGGGVKQVAKAGVTQIGYSPLPYNHTESRAFSWSPDGTQIAFIAEREGVQNVWVTAVRDGTERQLTSYSQGGVSLYCPTWSASGKSVAFTFQNQTRDKSGLITRGLRIADTVDGQVNEIFSTGKRFRLLGWTFDENGLIIAEPSKEFSVLPPETTISRVPLTKGSPVEVSRIGNLYYYNIFLSADRKQIAYAARNGDVDNVWVMPVASGNPSKLTNNNDPGTYISQLAWTPDGSSIAYAKQTRFALLSLVSEVQ